MVNIFTNNPKIGDAVVGEISTGKVCFITSESYSNADLSSAYEKIGVVYARRGKQVKIVYKENAYKPWCSVGWHKLTGYTLDGTDRSGVISARFVSNFWGSNIDKTISYNATTLEDFVSQLNTAFKGDSDFLTQEWEAQIVGDDVVLNYTSLHPRQFYCNTAKSGFTLSSALPSVASLADIRRKHGGAGGEGVISSMPRALAFFRPDESSTMYNPDSDVTSVKREYPVCLPAYLGTSKYQSDHCSLLRQVYGEGEQGWLKFMESCMPVKPTDYGNMGMRDGLATTKALATFAKADGTACCPAADYAYSKSTVCLPKGNWYLPTIEDLSDLLDTVKYGTDRSRNADVINAMLYKMGGSAISNGFFYWSCCRYDAFIAWFALGLYGFFGNLVMSLTYVTVPVSLYLLP